MSSLQQPLLDSETRAVLIRASEEGGPPEGEWPRRGSHSSLRHESMTFALDGDDFDEHLYLLPAYSALRAASLTFTAHPDSPRGDEEEPEEESTFWWTVMQVAKVILGSGVLVLPKAFQLLGVGLATALLAFVGVVTWFTINGLVYASERINKHTFAAVVRLLCGRPAKWGLLAAVFANCAGMCVVFLVIYADILVGAAPEHGGIIHDLLPNLPNDSWLLSRRLAVLVVLLGLLAPLSAQRDLYRLSPLAIAGVGSIILFAASTLALTGAAAWHGALYPLPVLPDWQGLASGGGNGANGEDGSSHPAPPHPPQPPSGPSCAALVQGIAAVVPLLLNSDICHQSIFPAMGLLKPYTRRSFNYVTAFALALCNVLYATIALCCITVFGPALDANVLNNMTASTLRHLLGRGPAFGLALLVRVAYFVSLLGSFVFTLHPLRHCVLEVLLGSNFPTKKQQKADRLFLPITFLLLAACYLVAMEAPGIWVVMQLVGSCASTVMGFIFPGLVILAIMRKAKWTHVVKKTLAVMVIMIGVALFVNGFSVLNQESG